MPNPYLAPEVSETPEVAIPPTVKTADGGPVEFDPRVIFRPDHLRRKNPLGISHRQVLRRLPLLPRRRHYRPWKTQRLHCPEADPTMDRVRIGGENASKFNLPKLTGRNLRVAALATGVAVVGLVAAKGVFGAIPAWIVLFRARPHQ